MSVVYYITVVLAVSIISVVCLARSKKPNLNSYSNSCPACGSRMVSNATGHNHFAQICPSCTCCSDEFGNTL